MRRVCLVRAANKSYLRYFSFGGPLLACIFIPLRASLALSIVYWNGGRLVGVEDGAAGHRSYDGGKRTFERSTFNQPISQQIYVLKENSVTMFSL